MPECGAAVFFQCLDRPDSLLAGCVFVPVCLCVFVFCAHTVSLSVCVCAHLCVVGTRETDGRGILTIFPLDGVRDGQTWRGVGGGGGGGTHGFVRMKDLKWDTAVPSPSLISVSELNIKSNLRFSQMAGLN